MTVDKIEEVINKVVKRGNRWCLIHCHGPDIGKIIKCFSPEEGGKEAAERMHRAIQARKSEFESENVTRIKNELMMGGFNETEALVRALLLCDKLAQ